MRTLSAWFFLVLLAAPAFAQKSKPWTEWSKKDAEKILNSSAWGQTQTEGEASATTTESAVTAVGGPPPASGRQLSRSGESGASKPSTLVRYRVRFLTAKPVREAFARMVLLSQEKPSEELAQQLQSFVDRDFGDYIVVVISVETADKRSAGQLMQAFSGATSETLQKTTYLERKDGQRLFLIDYRAPSGDGMGAKLIFPRMVGGQPFLQPESEAVRFVADLNEKIKLNMKYKLSEMTYEGKLEY